MTRRLILAAALVAAPVYAAGFQDTGGLDRAVGVGEVGEAQRRRIRRNDPVMIEAGNDGFSITREGVAMGDAAPGGRFMVKVEGAKGPVQATAVAPGRATLPGWGE